MATFCPRPAYRYRPHSRRPPINPADYYLSLQFRSARTCVIDECGFELAVCVGGGSISKCSSMELVWAILFQFFRSVGQNLESALMLIDCASSLFGSHWWTTLFICVWRMSWWNQRQLQFHLKVTLKFIETFRNIFPSWCFILLFFSHSDCWRLCICLGKKKNSNSCRYCDAEWNVELVGWIEYHSD